MKNELSSYLENISVFILGIFFLSFPLVFSTLTTDLFTLPKQILLAGVVLLCTLLFGIKTISEGKIKIRRTPFDLPLFVFTVIVFVSGILSQNRYDALTAFVPLLLAVLGYYIIVNFVRDQSALLFTTSSLIVGAVILSLFSILTFLKIYPLPFAFTKTQSFTPMGPLLDQAIYLGIILSVSGWPVIGKIKKLKEIEIKTVLFSILSLIILVGLSVTIYQLVNLSSSGKSPLILPFETGFQTTMAAISQDSGRVIQSFLFGSGFGTYITDFTRFKQPIFNSTPLWSFSFFRSSSFILELLATTGFLGLSGFIFLLIKIIREIKKIKGVNGIKIGLILAITTSFLLPFSFILQTLFILLLALFSAYASLKNNNDFFDIEYKFLTFKKGLISSPSKILPIFFSLLLVILVGSIAYFGGKFVLSDIIFQKSLVSASQNQGLQSYNDQVKAIKLFPYRDGYLRIYSQTNLALANNLAAQQPKGASPSAQTQQTITAFIQQSINAGRSATAISPLTSANWQNLSSIYKSLIGFGENASNFAVAANQKAISLDPNNPNQYINLGGIYYRLEMWDQAIQQFQVAVKLKPDFANAYYNLGHALESKGDLENGLAQYEIVKTLVVNDKDSLKKIEEEIKVLRDKIGTVSQKNKTEESVKTSSTQQPPLDLSTPSAQLPERKPPVKIPQP